MIGLALSALEVSGALGITKYVGFKEGLVGFGSVIVMGRTLRMEFQGGLEALQGLINLVPGEYNMPWSALPAPPDRIKQEGKPAIGSEFAWSLDVHGVRGLYQPLRRCSPRARG